MFNWLEEEYVKILDWHDFSHTIESLSKIPNIDQNRLFGLLKWVEVLDSRYFVDTVWYLSKVPNINQEQLFKWLKEIKTKASVVVVVKKRELDYTSEVISYELYEDDIIDLIRILSWIPSIDQSQLFSFISKIKTEKLSEDFFESIIEIVSEIEDVNEVDLLELKKRSDKLSKDPNIVKKLFKKIKII
jgi:hypothetical protein